MTTIAQLQALGAVPSPDYEKVTVAWDRSHLGLDTVDVNVWVRRQTTGDLEAAMSAAPGDKLAVRISRQVRLGDNGDEPITQAFAAGLDPLLSVAISRAVDALGAGEKKASKKTT